MFSKSIPEGERQMFHTEKETSVPRTGSLTSPETGPLNCPRCGHFLSSKGLSYTVCPTKTCQNWSRSCIGTCCCVGATSPDQTSLPHKSPESPVCLVHNFHNTQEVSEDIVLPVSCRSSWKNLWLKMKATPLISSTLASAVVFLFLKLAVMAMANFPLNSFLLKPSLTKG